MAYFATVEEVRANTSFEEVRALTEAQLQSYIERANSYLRRKANKNYRDETDPDLLVDLRRVTILLVEYLWYNDLPEVKESNLAGLQTERIGTYSYNKGDKDGTGNQELDDLLAYLTVKPGSHFFSVSGPSRYSKPNEERPAWLTRRD